MFTTRSQSHAPWLSDPARLAMQSSGQVISPPGSARREKIPLLLSVHCRDLEAL